MSPIHRFLLLVTGLFVPLSILGNDLKVGSASGLPNSTVLVPVSVVKTSPVVGVQFDLCYPGSLADSTAPSVRSLNSDHGISSEDYEAEDRRKVVLFSPTNVEIPSDLEMLLPLDLQSNSPGGGPSLTIKNIIFTDAQGNTFASNVIYDVFETWRRQHFTEAERAIPDLVGDNADPDFDFVPNLLEMASGTDPRSTADAFLPTVSQDLDAGQVTLNFWQTKDNDVLAVTSLEAQRSTDLTLWEATGFQLLTTGSETLTSRELEATMSLNGLESRLFFRVQARRAP